MIRSSRFHPVRATAALLAVLATSAAAAPAAAAPAGTDTTEPTGTTDAGEPTETTEVDRSDWPDTLTFGAVPSEETTSLQEDYVNVIALLEEELGLKVEFFQATDYAGIIEAQISGEVDLAQYGPFSYVLAVHNGAEIEPVGAMADSADEETPGYQSYGIARADNDDVEGIEDFAGRTTCFVDPGSTSGYLFPTAGLIEAGIDPAADITPVFAGGHDASALSVANGDCEVGFAYDAMVTEQLIADGQLEEGDLKVVWESEVIPSSPMAISTTLPESLVSEVRRVITEQANLDALLESGRCESEEDCKINDEGSWGYIPVDDEFYDGVRAVCEATESEACQS